MSPFKFNIWLDEPNMICIGYTEYEQERLNENDLSSLKGRKMKTPKGIKIITEIQEDDFYTRATDSKVTLRGYKIKLQ